MSTLVLMIRGTDLRVGQRVKIKPTGEWGTIVRSCPVSSVKLLTSTDPVISVKIDETDELRGYESADLTTQMDLFEERK